MFTGIIEACVPLQSVASSSKGKLIALALPPAWTGVKLGDSIAINGCCLTVAESNGAQVSFFAVPETLKLTNLADVHSGDVVNLERAMAAGARFDGHLVQGHIDTTGTIANIVREGEGWRVSIAAAQSFLSQCVLKGSVCVDGISLTIAALTSTVFEIAVVPHTWGHTNLSTRRAGDHVNLEADVIGKYVRRTIEQMQPGRGDGVSVETLQQAGFLAGEGHSTGR